MEEAMKRPPWHVLAVGGSAAAARRSGLTVTRLNVVGMSTGVQLLVTGALLVAVTVDRTIERCATVTS
jgi:hypothetical protein